MRVCIVGAGSIGSFVGARLARSGAQGERFPIGELDGSTSPRAAA